MNNEILPFDRATAAGHKFFAGAPCLYGHVGIRYVKSKGVCIDCHRARAADGRRSSSEKQYEYWQRYYAKNKDKRKIAARIDNALHPEKRRERRRRQKEQNPDKSKEISRQTSQRRRREPTELFLAQVAHSNACRRSRMAGFETQATARQILALKRWQGDKCAYCGADGDLHLDHKIALARGGRHAIGNLQWLCKPCNKAKFITPDDEYRETNGISNLTQWDAQYTLIMCLLSSV